MGMPLEAIEMIQAVLYYPLWKCSLPYIPRFVVANNFGNCISDIATIYIALYESVIVYIPEQVQCIYCWFTNHTDNQDLNCSFPNVESHVNVEWSYTGNEGSQITYHCQSWRVPSEVMVANCTNGTWSPDPGSLSCPGLNVTDDGITHKTRGPGIMHLMLYRTCSLMQAMYSASYNVHACTLETLNW